MLELDVGTLMVQTQTKSSQLGDMSWALVCARCICSPGPGPSLCSAQCHTMWSVRREEGIKEEGGCILSPVSPALAPCPSSRIILGHGATGDQQGRGVKEDRGEGGWRSSPFMTPALPPLGLTPSQLLEERRQNRSTLAQYRHAMRERTLPVPTGLQ